MLNVCWAVALCFISWLNIQKEMCDHARPCCSSRLIMRSDQEETPAPVRIRCLTQCMQTLHFTPQLTRRGECTMDGSSIHPPRKEIKWNSLQHLLARLPQAVEWGALREIEKLSAWLIRPKCVGKWCRSHPSYIINDANWLYIRYTHHQFIFLLLLFFLLSTPLCK